MTALQLAPPMTPREAPAAGSAKFLFAAIVTLLLAVVPAVFWPGDAYWMWDEPKLIGQALHFNELHQLAPRGLNGNFAIPYGPFPTQCYQLLLLISHNLAVITFIRAFASSALLAISLLWLAKSLRLTWWFAAAMLMAPFLVWTERTLWDATFAIPITALAVAAYAAFLRNGSGKWLVLALGAAVMDPLIHMQGLPLFAAIAGHAIWRHRADMRRNWLGLGLILAVIVFLNWGYASIFYNIIRWSLFGMFKNGYPNRTAPGNIVDSFFGPLWAGHNLTGENPVVPRTGLPGPAWLAPRAVQISLIFYGFAWLGIVGCLIRLGSILRHRRVETAAATPATAIASVRDEMICICLAALGMQMLLAASLRIPGQPQYSFGMFSIHVLFAWAGVEILRRYYLGILPVIYGLAVGYLTIGGAISVHQNGWPRGILSPSINNQMAIARQLNHYSDDAIWTDVSTSSRFSRSMQALRSLIPPEDGARQVRSPHGLLLRYRPDMPASSQVIELIELPATASPPTNPGVRESAELLPPDPSAPILPPGMATEPLQRLSVKPFTPLY